MGSGRSLTTGAARVVGPYRAPAPRPAATLVLRPTLARRIIGLCIVLTLAPTGLFLGLWSRVVDVDCTSDRPGALRCDVHEETIVQASRHRVALTGVKEVRLAGATDRTRGDTWIEADCDQGWISLTDGFNLDKFSQGELAERLGVAAAVGRGRIQASFGSRWGALFVPIMCAVGSLLILAMLGTRVKLTLDHAHRLLTVERRRRLRRSRVSIELAQIDDIVIGAEGRREAIVAKTRRGPIPLFATVDGPRFQPKVRSWFVAETTDDD